MAKVESTTITKPTHMTTHDREHHLRQIRRGEGDGGQPGEILVVLQS